MTEPVDGLGGMQKVVLRSPKVCLRRCDTALSAADALIALCPASSEVPLPCAVQNTLITYASAMCLMFHGMQGSTAEVYLYGAHVTSWTVDGKVQHPTVPA